MRSNRLNKRALDQTDKKDWPLQQEAEEIDAPGNKTVALVKSSKTCPCGNEGCEGCGKGKGKETAAKAAASVEDTMKTFLFLDNDGAQIKIRAKDLVEAMQELIRRLNIKVIPTASTAASDDGKAKTADWIGDLIKQTVQYLTQHRNDPDLNQKVQSLPLARKVGPTALQNPVNQFVQDGNSSALVNELETIVQGKRTFANKKKAEESSVEIDAPKKEKTEGEQPEGFVDPKRPIPDEKPVKPSADNAPKVVNPELPGTHRRVELDAHTDADPAPSAWSVDNTREIQHKAAGNFDTSKQTPAKVDPSPTAWSIDNTRETRHELSELTTEEQDEMKRKNGNLEVFIPKTAEEIDFIVQASGSWVGERLNKGVFAGKMPTFIINASEAVAVVSAFGDVFDAQSSKPTNKYASILNPSAKTAMDGPGGPDHRGPDLLPPPYSAGLRGGSELAGEPSEIILIIKSKSFGVREVILPVNDKPLHAGTLPGLVQRACDQMLAGHYTTKSSAKTAAAGGAAEEPESEEETSVDSVVVSLLEACKSEWTSLGDPVNPATWPKEIDRALLSLNDELVAAIKKVEDKLVEGEFYSKNVDEGLEGGGSSVDSLNIAPPETEAPDAMPMGDEGIPEADGLNTAADEADEPLLSEAPKTGGLKKRAGLDDVNQVPDFRGGIGLDTPPLPPSEALPQRNEFKVTFEDGNSLVTGFNGTLDDANAYYVGHGFNHGDVDGKDRIVRAVRVEQLNAPKIASAKNAVELPDVTTTETRKALKFTQSLQGDIATKFFEFKKVVQEANDSSLVKNVGEAFVALKTKLEDVEKILSKQLLLLETAESSIQDKKDSNAKKSFLLGADNFVKCSKCGKDFSCSPYGKEEKEPVCPNCEKGEKKEASAKTAFYPLLVIFKELKDFQQAHPEMSEEEALKAFASTGQGREIVQRAAERLSRAAEADVQKLQLTNQNHPTASAKTAACPVCGATVMQNGRDTNGVLCPNCADKPSTQVPGTSQSTTTPAVPKLPQNGPVNPSPIKQYGSKSKFKGLNLASAE